MASKSLNWEAIYFHIKETKDTLYFYVSLEKKYYSLNRNMDFFVYKITKAGKIKKEKEVCFQGACCANFCTYMREKYNNKKFILSPNSQIKMCEDEGEAIQKSEKIKLQLRKLLTKIIGEQEFREGDKQFSEMGLNSTYNPKLSLMAKILICWIEEKEEKSVVPDTLSGVFFLYGRLTYEDTTREVYDEILIERNDPYINE